MHVYRPFLQTHRCTVSCLFSFLGNYKGLCSMPTKVQLFPSLFKEASSTVTQAHAPRCAGKQTKAGAVLSQSYEPKWWWDRPDC